MLLTLVLLAQAAAATPATGPAPIAVTEIVQAEGRTATQLYSAALAWIPTAFKSTKAVTELADREGGRIVLKGSAPWSRSPAMSMITIAGDLHFAVTIEVKDGRFRYSIDGFHFIFTEPTGPRGTGYGPVTDAPEYEGPLVTLGDKKNWKLHQVLARETCASLAASLKAALAKPADEW